jgi:hypothetical protein
MRNYLYIVFFIPALYFVFAQQIKVDFIIKNDLLAVKERTDFMYLDQKIDLTTAKYIGWM